MPSITHHPRRRQASPSSIDSVSESLKALALAKGSTFHSPSSDPDLCNPFLKPFQCPSLPSRSATCPKSLEDLLIGAGERRAVELLKRVDDAIAKNVELGSILSEPEVLPIPRFMVENASFSHNKLSEEDQSLSDDNEHQHGSDSGLGSSIAESTSEKIRRSSSGMCGERGSGTMHNTFTVAADSPSSAVTRSFTTTSTIKTPHGLSEFAQKQINKHLIKPILAEDTLKDFHRLIKDIPKRIGCRDITTLRDLEKTLIFLAPVSPADRHQDDRAFAYWRFGTQDYSRSPAAYRAFCETSIRCLHLTVNGVHETDQCLPSDRPYSTNYFIDLVEQIRRYAAILAATRERQARGEQLDEMDPSPYVFPVVNGPLSPKLLSAGHQCANPPCRTDRIELQGGMSHNGKPAFLTRSKDGKDYISLASNQPTTAEDVAATSTKRPMDDVVDDDGTTRSMARRKKDAPILTYYCDAPGCKKNFKRPCDLTKHQKTHDRPWKCDEVDCKYHTVGWPTEKEMQRHWNDKHDSSPMLYKCFFDGCPYTSKRESNCKQHMEKSHPSYVYQRSKGGSKGKARARSATTKASPSSDSAIGSFTPIAPSPSIQSLSSLDAQAGAMGPPSTNFLFPPNPPLFDFNSGFESHFNPDYLNVGMHLPITPALTDDRHMSEDTSVTDYSPFEQPISAFEDAMKPYDYDFTMFDQAIQQQPTPESASSHLNSAGPSTFWTHAQNTPAEQTLSAHISPYAGAMTFTSPALVNGAKNMDIDESFGDNYAADQDFQLFANGGSAEPLFHDQSGLDSMGSQFNASSQPGTNLLDLFPELKRED